MAIHEGPRPYSITERTFEFALAVVQACRLIEKQSWVAKTLCSQLLRSATSIGANVEEAQGAFGRADFTSKNVIALKEAREAVYWLRLVTKTEILSPREANELLCEARQLAKILGAIVATARGQRKPT